MPSAILPRKRLIVCCDGTWMSSVTAAKNVPSNVTRLARSIAREGIDKEDGSVWQQLVYYDPGIGTGELSQAEANRQAGLGVGFVSNVIHAYNFLVLNYSPGDKIYCFGFSRGAYTARAVAGLVNDIGIVSPRDMQDFPELYAKYQKNTDSNGFRRSKEYREWVTDDEGHKPVPETSRVVEVVGVFDTVGSLGIPHSPYWGVDLAMRYFGWRMGSTKAGFHNVELSPYIRNAFHALALDERRGPFTPTLWHLPQRKPKHNRKHEKGSPHADLLQEWKDLYHNKNSTEEELHDAWVDLIDCEMEEHLNGIGRHEADDAIENNLLQVWFPGMHANIGGGDKDLLEQKRGDLEQIALISYAWMCEQIAPMLQLEEDVHAKAWQDRMLLVKPLMSDFAKSPPKDFGGPAEQLLWRTLDYVGLWKAELKKINEAAISGWATGPVHDSFEGLLILTGAKTRTPGKYRYDDANKDLGDTKEEIHPSVYYRARKLGYSPRGLKGFERRPCDNMFKWINDETGAFIPEYEIRQDHTFTRYIIDQEGQHHGNNAKDFLREIDLHLGRRATAAF